jgi:tetratricopeptide (TPR) repeat protein
MRVLLSKAISRLLVVATLWAFCPLESAAHERTHIDSLRIAFDYSENALERVYIQIEIADAYYRLRSTDTAIFEYRKAIGIIPNDSLELKGKHLSACLLPTDKKKICKVCWKPNL